MYFCLTSSVHHDQPFGYMFGAPLLAETTAGGWTPLLSLMYMSIAWASCLMLLAHLTVIAWRRARESAGSRIDTSTAMMPMTTNSSTSVNARRFFICFTPEPCDMRRNAQPCCARTVEDGVTGPAVTPPPFSLFSSTRMSHGHYLFW